MSDHKALIAEARTTGGYVESELRWLCRQLADALESVSVERAVVEAQALEQAADALYGPMGIDREVPKWLRARAVEIREGRQ